MGVNGELKGYSNAKVLMNCELGWGDCISKSAEVERVGGVEMVVIELGGKVDGGAAERSV